MSGKHGAIADCFDKNFPQAVVDKWTVMVEEWDDDQKKPNPYKEPETGGYRN